MIKLEDADLNLLLNVVKALESPVLGRYPLIANKSLVQSDTTYFIKDHLATVLGQFRNVWHSRKIDVSFQYLNLCVDIISSLGVAVSAMGWRGAGRWIGET